MVLMGFFKKLVKGVANLATMGAIKSYDAQKQAMQQQALYQQIALQQQQQAMDNYTKQAQAQMAQQKALQERELASQEQNLNQQSKYNVSAKRESKGINSTDLTKGNVDTTTTIKMGLVGDDESGDEWY